MKLFFALVHLGLGFGSVTLFDDEVSQGHLSFRRRLFFTRPVSQRKA